MNTIRTGLYQGTQLKQEMKINPRLYQAMDLLYMPLLDLQQHIKQELLNNPFLELEEPQVTEAEGRKTYRWKSLIGCKSRILLFQFLVYVTITEFKPVRSRIEKLRLVGSERREATFSLRNRFYQNKFRQSRDCSVNCVNLPDTLNVQVQFQPALEKYCKLRYGEAPVPHWQSPFLHDVLYRQVEQLQEGRLA